MANLSSVFKNGSSKIHWQIAAVGEKGRKVWMQDGRSAFVFDLETATWTVVPDFPDVHKEVSFSLPPIFPLLFVQNELLMTYRVVQRL